MKGTDLFTNIHKGVRAMLFDTVTRVQNADAAEETQRRELSTVVLHRLDMMHGHGEHEDHSIFPLVQSVAPETVASLEGEHQHVDTLASEVRDSAGRFGAASSTDEAETERLVLLHALSAFVAAHLQHMNREEREILPLTWEHASEEQRASALREIIGGMTPERYDDWMEWMLPALSPQELAGMLRSMAESAPPQVLAHNLSLAEAWLPARRWEHVRRLVELETPAAA